MLTFYFSKCLNIFRFKAVKGTLIIKMPEINKAYPSVLKDNLTDSKNLIVQLKGEVRLSITKQNCKPLLFSKQNKIV